MGLMFTNGFEKQIHPYFFCIIKKDKKLEPISFSFEIPKKACEGFIYILIGKIIEMTFFIIGLITNIGLGQLFKIFSYSIHLASQFMIR